MSKPSSNKITQFNLKKKILSSYQAELNPMEAFKTFLVEIIKYKASLKTTDEPSPHLTIKEPNSPIQIKINKKNRNSMQVREDEQMDQLIQDNKDKNQMLLNSCKKMKQKMRLEKVDSALKFFKHKVQPFSELKTFINAREFLEKVNPFQNGPVVHDNQYLQDKSMHTLQKLHRQSIEFFDNKNKELIERLDELNQRKTSKPKKDGEEASNISSEQNIDEISEPPQPNLLPASQTIESTPLSKLPKMDPNPTKPIQKSTISMLASMPNLKPIGEINQSSGKSRFMGTRNTLETMRKQLIKTLTRNDKSLNKKDFELENENIVDGDFNEFYSNLELQFQKQKNLKLLTPENFDKELESLLRLEKMVSNLIQDQAPSAQNTQNVRMPEAIEKYKDFQQKTSEIIKMIGHTSRNIFNEGETPTSKASATRKNSVFSIKKNDNDMALSFASRRTSQDLRSSFYKPPGINLPHKMSTSILSRKYSKPNLSHSSFVGVIPTPKRKESSFYSPKMMNERRSLAVLSIMPSINEKEKSEQFIESKDTSGKFNKKIGLGWRKSLSIASAAQSPKGNMSISMGQSKKLSPRWISNGIKNYEIMDRLEDIIKKTNDVTSEYEESRADLQKMATQTDNFYIETNKKISPPLESLVMTLDKKSSGEKDKHPLFMRTNKKKKKPLIIL